MILSCSLHFIFLNFSFFGRKIRKILLICKECWSEINYKTLEEICKRNDGIPDSYKIDEIDVGSPFFYNFWDIFIRSNRIIWFSKSLVYATCSIKKFEYEELKSKHFFDLSSEWHVNKYKLLFILNSLPETFEQHRNGSKTNFVPLSHSITITFSLKSALYIHYYNNYKVVGVWINFVIRLTNTCIQKVYSENGTYSETDLKFDELEEIYQILSFLVNYITSF